VYGNPPAAASGYIEEDHCPPQPSALYGITKLSVELLVQRLALVHGLRAAIVRVGPVYGPWEHATGVRDILSPPQQVLDAALKASGQANGRGQDTAIVLPARAPADFIYARDVAAGIAAIAEATNGAPKTQTTIFNLAGGKLVDLAQWCEALAPLIPSFQWRVAVDDEPATIVHTVPKGRAALSMDKLKTRIGFVPQFDLATAAKDYIAWLQADISDPKHEDRSSIKTGGEQS
jgi:UDP-glucose 4-epimerase/UDP-glucuronate 4-epimerase